MNKRIWISIILVIISLFIAVSTSGCSCLMQKIETMKPEVTGVSHQWGEVTEDTTGLMTIVTIYNPNSFTLPIKDINGDVEVAGIKIGDTSSQDVYVGKNGEYPIMISTSIDNNKIPDLWVAHLNNREKSIIEINADIVFDLKVTEFTYPYHLAQPLETDILSILHQDDPIIIENDLDVPLPGDFDTFRVIVKSITGSWEAVTRDNTNVNFSAVIQNDNPYPVVIPGIAYELIINGIVVASDETEINAALMPALEGTINAVMILDNVNLTDSFIQHIRNGESSTYQIDISVVYELPTEDELIIPVFSESQQFQTNFLGN